MKKEWFEMKDIRRRRTPEAAWIPLRIAEHFEQEGEYGYDGYKEEFLGVGSVAIPVESRAEAQKLGWMDIGLIHNHGVWATADYYKRAEIYQYNDKHDLGIALVLEQELSGEPHQWHLNQDLVFALGLLREGDIWVRPQEGYVQVARMRRDKDSHPIAIEIKNEFLRDYLCARKMFLRLSSYQKRDVCIADASYLGWPEGGIEEKTEADRYFAHSYEIVEGGHPAGSDFAVFHMGRTDVDPEVDVPRPGPESEANVESRSWTGTHKGKKLYRAMGELWRSEEVEPGNESERVRGDRVPTGIHYIVDASGKRLESEALNNEDDPRWLWFKPEVVPALLKFRGSKLNWYTYETGGVTGSPSYTPTHFGLNPVGLVTVYAYDIAKLARWLQQIWSGYNVAPDGKVSRELLSAQMRAVPAETRAPETTLLEVMAELDELFRQTLGFTLFREHGIASDLARNCHRFRAVDQGGVCGLAKDLSRLIAERIDASGLQGIAHPPKGEKWRSLKTLERYLGTIVPPDRARRVMEPLAGAYELRLADAHLPSEEVREAYALAHVDPADIPIKQGTELITSVVSALDGVRKIMLDAPD